MKASYRAIALVAFVGAIGCRNLDDLDTACSIDPRRCDNFDGGSDGGDAYVADDASVDSDDARADGDAVAPVDSCSTTICEGPRRTRCGVVLETCEGSALCRPDACLQVAEVAARGNATCARLNDDSVWCWGDAASGQLGDGRSTGFALQPQVVPGVAAKQIVMGTAMTVARLADGTLTWWGTVSNGSGVIIKPTAVAGVKDVIDVAAGDHVCARLSDATVKCWGNNDRGQLGDGSSTDQFVPTANPGLLGASSITAANYFGCALISGNAKCWGDNSKAQVGDGTTALSRPSPTPVTTASGSALYGLSQLASNATASCAVDFAHASSVKCWGTGAMGNGTTTQHFAADVAGIAGATQVTVGNLHACAILADETVRCWGRNAYGQLGDGSRTPSETSPVTPGGLDTVVQLASGDAHTCARKANGSVRCWGSNSNGQIGDGYRDDRWAPVSVLWP